MASADWMPRNLERRVEILFPVLNSELKEKVYHVLEVQLADNQKAQVLKPDGTYEKIDADGEEPRNAQDEFCKEYISLAKGKEKEKLEARTFKPEYKE
jgi:polyphosphate kinase